MLLCTCPVTSEHALNASCVGAESGTLVVQPMRRMCDTSHNQHPSAMPPEVITVPAGTVVSVNPAYQVFMNRPSVHWDPFFSLHDPIGVLSGRKHA